jgi:hypothetical protein
MLKLGPCRQGYGWRLVVSGRTRMSKTSQPRLLLRRRGRLLLASQSQISWRCWSNQTLRLYRLYSSIIPGGRKP